MKPRFPKSILATTAALLAGLATTHAATVVTAVASNATHSTDSAYPANWTSNFTTANDVLLGLTPQSTGTFAQPVAGMNLATVNNGVLTPVPGNNNDLTMFAGVGPGAGTQLIFTLAQPSLISAVQYFGGWSDAGRCDVNFTVSYSTDGGNSYTALIDPAGGSYSTKDDPADIQIGGMSNGGTNTFVRHLGGAGPISTYVSVTDNATTYLGNNAAITNLKFDFGSVANDWAGLEELTATGVAVPEASASLLAVAGITASLLRRRRA